MKKGNLKVGISDPKFAVKVQIDQAETLEDVTKLARGSVQYVVDCFMRGHRINLQESDARQTVLDMVAGKTTPERENPQFVEKVAKAVEKNLADFDPTAERKRGGRPAKPVNVEVTKKTYTVEEMQALLSAAGAKVQFVSNK